jgi:hypothetical protein
VERAFERAEGLSFSPYIRATDAFLGDSAEALARLAGGPVALPDSRE